MRRRTILLQSRYLECISRSNEPWSSWPTEGELTVCDNVLEIIVVGKDMSPQPNCNHAYSLKIDTLRDSVQFDREFAPIKTEKGVGVRFAVLTMCTHRRRLEAHHW